MSSPLTFAELLAEDEQYVHESERGMAPPVLADAGLVTARKDGRHRVYSVVPTGITQLRAEIDRFWSTELDLLVDDAIRTASPRPEGHRA